MDCSASSLCLGRSDLLSVPRRSRPNRLLTVFRLGHQPRHTHGYSLAVISVVLAFLLRLAVDRWLGDHSPYILFVVAVAVTGLFAGLRPAVVAAVLGAITAYFCFVPPRYLWGFAGVSDAVGFGVYVLAAVAVILLTRARNTAAQRAERSLAEQVEAERKLRDAEALFQRFMDHTAARAYLRDETGNCVYSNEAARRIFDFGSDRRRIAGTGPVLQDANSERSQQDQEVLRAGRAVQFVEQASNAEGTREWLTCKFPFTDQSGRRFVGVISFDVSDRMQAEEILHKTERLAAAGQMASLLAHEVNNPLAAVTNLLYLLSEQPLPPTAQKFVAEANHELARVNHIAAMTIGFYFEKDAPAPVQVCQLIDEVVEALSAIDSFQRIRVDRSYRSKETVVASPPRVRQMLTNLLANAMEAGSRNIRVRVASARNWHRPEQPGLCITIADDGRGIPREHYDQLFQPFFTTKAEKGTGLGLWASKAVVLRNNGTIRLRSAVTGPRVGTCIRVFLPASVQAPVVGPPSRRAVKTGS